MYLYTTCTPGSPWELLQLYNYGYAFLYKHKIVHFTPIFMCDAMYCYIGPHKQWWPTNTHYSTTKVNFCTSILNWHWRMLIWWC